MVNVAQVIRVPELFFHSFIELDFDCFFATGHGPFSHMFDGKILPSIGIKTKVMLLSLKGWGFQIYCSF